MESGGCVRSNETENVLGEIVRVGRAKEWTKRKREKASDMMMILISR